MHSNTSASIEGLFIADRAVALGHQHNFATRDTKLAHSLSHDAFGLAVGVNIGCVPRVDAAIVRRLEQRQSLQRRVSFHMQVCES